MQCVPVYVHTCMLAGLHAHVRVYMCIIIVCIKYYSNIIGLQMLIVGEEKVDPGIQNKLPLLVELPVIRDLGMHATPTRKSFLMSTTRN